MKLQNLINLKPSLEKLVTKDLPVKLAFKLGKLVKDLNIEYANFEEAKQKLFNNYGEEKEGKRIIKEENVKEFTKDLEELLNIKVDITIQKVKLDDLGDIKLSPVDMSNLDILIEE